MLIRFIKGEGRETRVKGEMNVSIYKTTLSLLLSLLSPVSPHTTISALLRVYMRGWGEKVKRDVIRYFPAKVLRDARGNSRATNDSLFFASGYSAGRTHGRPGRSGAPLGQRGRPCGQRVATNYGG